jgi:hypothetical protein
MAYDAGVLEKDDLMMKRFIWWLFCYDTLVFLILAAAEKPRRAPRQL